MRNYLLVLTAMAFLAACGSEDKNPTVEAQHTDVDAAVSASEDTNVTLETVLAAQPDDMKARYTHRNPQETIEFFGIEPGMTVLEGLPGRGWYTKILLPYLGAEGCVIGASYSLEMYQLFPFANEDFMARQRGWQAGFADEAAEWGGESGASAEAFHFASMPEKYAGTVDVAFFPRVLHNPANFENQGISDYLTQILSDVHTALKPGGVLGVVQHEARSEMPDAFSDGSHGYLKKAWMIEQIEAAGFEFVAESAVNANPKDQPAEGDVVWRLPPSYNGTRDDPELKAAVDAIGESNRMTLKFRKL